MKRTILAAPLARVNCCALLLTLSSSFACSTSREAAGRRDARSDDPVVVGSTPDAGDLTVPVDTAPATPILILSPAIVIDMDVVDGISPGPLVTFTLANTGNAATALLQSPKLHGINFGNFELANGHDRCTGISLAPGFTCTFAVQPLSNANGRYSATLTVGDGITSSNVGSLGGIASGFDPALTITATEGDPLGMNVTHGNAEGRGITVTVENEGAKSTAPLAEPTLGGDAPAHFRLIGEANECSGQTLTPGQRCSFAVEAVADANGSYSATLTIGDGSTLSNILSLSGSASGFDPILVLSVSLGDRENMHVQGGNSPGTAVRFQLSNTGVAATATLREPLIEGDSQGHFEVLSNECAGQSLAPGASCVFSVRPRAAANWSYSAELSINDGSVRSNELTLSGRASGFDPRLALGTLSGNPTAMNISGQSPGETVTFEASNTGKANTQALSAPRIIGGNGHFEIVSGSDQCVGNTLAPGVSCQFSLRPVSTSNGAYSAVLSISAGSLSSNEIGLNGVASGLTPNLVLSATQGNPQAMNISGNSPGAFVTLQLRNSGSATSAPLASPTLQGDTGVFELADNTCPGQRLVPGAHCTLRVRPTAVENGSYSATIRIGDGAADSNILTLQGNATGLVASITLTASGDPRAMNITNGNSPGPALTFTIRNTGTAATAPLSGLRYGGNPDAFEEVPGSNNCSGRSLVPSDDCSFQVRPLASSNGSYSASIRVDDGNVSTETLVLLGVASGF